ncbi:hypothetical protein PG996_006477 [Apiospora saccharicola]|uniref:Uncharacterized protein n=1 Tax=Apiospora saccharicola TaxID=335842 RepID=A0ABR1VTC5_9PEZI
MVGGKGAAAAVASTVTETAPAAVAFSALSRDFFIILAPALADFNFNFFLFLGILAEVDLEAQRLGVELHHYLLPLLNGALPLLHLGLALGHDVPVVPCRVYQGRRRELPIFWRREGSGQREGGLSKSLDCSAWSIRTSAAISRYEYASVPGGVVAFVVIFVRRIGFVGGLVAARLVQDIFERTESPRRHADDVMERTDPASDDRPEIRDDALLAALLSRRSALGFMSRRGDEGEATTSILVFRCAFEESRLFADYLAE